VINVAVIAAGEAGELIEVLTLAGVVAVETEDGSGSDEGAGDWGAALVDLRSEPLQQLRNARRIHEDVGCPVIVVVTSSQTALIENEPWIDDFISDAIDPLELRLRIHRLTGQGDGLETLRYKSLELNLATYQATVDGRPIDLTYMEYELLRFFIEHQGRVWSREQLLQKVWGYDYFGGARTVDVHVRRLRAKLGEERASWITTVRSVGYRFG
jgi:DNA-binding response OmpR family regulator